MPKYNYFCENCDFKIEKIISYNKRLNLLCEKCGCIMLISPSKTQESIVNELVDSYTNKVIKKNVGDIMKKRQIDHMAEHELKEMIDKHGLETIKKTKYFKNKKGKTI